MGACDDVAISDILGVRGGAGRRFCSLHAELDGSTGAQDVSEAHRGIDTGCDSNSDAGQRSEFLWP